MTFSVIIQTAKKENGLMKVNSIIQDGDDLNYTIDEINNECIIDLAFNGNVKNLKVSISKSTSAASKAK